MSERSGSDFHTTPLPMSSGQAARLSATPTRVGEYRVVRLLARGGMGAVYEAVHEPSGVTRAVKVLLRAGLAGADPEDAARFRREAELMAALDHPHVARVHAADLDADPGYIVQDLLPGGSLQERVKRGPLPVDDALSVALKLCSALAHAHARGVLHRDLKPANVLFDDRGEPRVTDFGLARGKGGSSLTATGQVIGTPAYMPPEQALGLSTIDRRSDVYGLGAILYAMLTGQPPFPGDTVTGVLDAVVNEPPPRPRALRPEVPPAVEAVVLRALAKERRDRFAGADDLARALRAAARAPDGARSRLVPVLAAAASLAVIAAVTALAVARRPAPAPTPPPPPVTAVAPGPAATERATEPAPPAEPAPDPLRGLEPGAHLHAVLGLLAERQDAHLSASLLLDVQAEAGGLQAQVRRVRVQVRGPFGLDHDGATNKGDEPEVRRAFESVVARRLRLVREEDALRVEGSAELRDGVRAAAASLRHDATRAWAVDAFADALEGGALARALTALLRAGGARGHAVHEETAELGGERVRVARTWQEVRAYTVRPRDMLGHIARAHGTQFPILALRNGIPDPNLIREGAVLEVPPSAPVVPARVVGLRRQVTARDRPWGHEVATLRATLRFVATAEDLGWARLDFRGGHVWVPADAVEPAQGRRVQVVTERQIVSAARDEQERLWASSGQVYVALDERADATLVQYDELPASIKTISLRSLD